MSSTEEHVNLTEIEWNRDWQDRVIDKELFDSVETEPHLGIGSSFDLAMKHIPFRPLWGTRMTNPDGSRGSYSWMTYHDGYLATAELAASFPSLEIGADDKVGILAFNRPEWCMSDFACILNGVTSVPLYSNQSTEDIIYIANHSEISIIFIESTLLKRYSSEIAEHLPNVRHVIVMDDRMSDRANVLRFRPDLAPKDVSTNLKSLEEIEHLVQITEATEKATEKIAAALKEESLLADVEDHLFDYSPPTYYTTSYDEEEAEALDVAWKCVTHTLTGLRAVGRPLLQKEDGVFMKYTADERYTHVGDVESVFSIIYTSGTTGRPRGVMLRERSLLWSGISMSFHVSPTASTDFFSAPFNNHDWQISYLPFAHVFSRMLSLRAVATGESTGFVSKGITYLTEEMALIRPTMLQCVPRVIQRIYAGFSSKLAAGSAIARTLFNRSYAGKHRAVFGKGTDAPTLGDRMILSKVRAALGFDRLEVVFSGSAALQVHLAEFFRTVFCHAIVEGYGCTETASGIICGLGEQRFFGHVGSPIYGMDMKLRSVPELNYVVPENSDEEVDEYVGELLVRGECNMLGYYKDEEATNAVLKDGWYETGDIAKFDVKRGVVSIIDRKRSAFKLSQGEFVLEARVNSEFMGSCDYLQQMFVLGRSNESFLISVVLPAELEFVTKFSKGRRTTTSGTDDDSASATDASVDSRGNKTLTVNKEALRRLTFSKRVLGRVAQAVEADGRGAGLRGFEIPRLVFVDTRAWTVDNGMLTPSLKARAPAIKTHYKELVDMAYAAMREAGYSEIGANPTPDQLGEVAANVWTAFTEKRGD